MSYDDDEEEDPLNKLLVDKDDINKQRLTDALEDKVMIDKETGEPVPTSNFDELDSGRRIVAILLARKVAKIIGIIDSSEEGLQSSVLSDYVKVASGTVRNHVGKRDFISQDNQYGGYYIPDTAVNQAIDYLEKKNK